MRRMGSPGREINEEWPGRGDRLLSAHPVDAVVGDVPRQVVALLGLARYWYGARAPVQAGKELVGFAADEAVEVVEAPARRPVVEGPRLAGLVVGDVVVFAPPAGGVTVLVQKLGDRRAALRDDPVVAGEPG